MTNISQRIIPHLWFDNNVSEAVRFYVSIFPESKIMNESVAYDTPSGDTAVVSFRLWGQEFMAINGGPHFTFNPSISFMINFDPSRENNANEKLTDMWDILSEGGKILMPLDTYPFSEKYGWLQDKYGVSWQLILTNPEGDERPAIIPSLLFVGDNCGKTEEAIQHYLSVFPHSTLGNIARHPEGMEPDKPGTILFSDFKLYHHWFTAQDSAYEHLFQFNEAISFLVNCNTQSEVDEYWNRLSAFPEAEQCGWLKDRYGISWQIMPKEMHDMMQGTPDQMYRVNQAALKMKKLDLATLQKAFNKD